MCHPERGRRATESNFCGSNISRQSREIERAKAQVLAYASRSGICDGFAQCLLSQSNQSLSRRAEGDRSKRKRTAVEWVTVRTLFHQFTDPI